MKIIQEDEEEDEDNTEICYQNQLYGWINIKIENLISTLLDRIPGNGFSIRIRNELVGASSKKSKTGGEEEKKPGGKKVEEKKPGEVVVKKAEEEVKKPEEEKKYGEEKKTEETKEETPPPPPPPPEETILRVFMHCEGCAKKVRKCLRGFEGVEDVKTDCKTHIVTVKGKKAAENPLKVLERVQKKSHRKVELLSPIPKPPSEDDKKVEEKKEEPKPVEEKKEEVVIIVVIKVHMHCEACAQEIRKRILRMKGVKEAVPDLKSSQVTVKGVFDPPKLIEYIYKRTGKHAVIVKTEPEKKEEGKKEGEGEKKGEGEEEKKKEEGEKKEGGGGGGGDGEKKEGGGGGGEEEKKKEGGEEEAKPVEGEEKTEKVEVELIKNEFYYYPPKYNMEYVYPPQIFSDENPNACSVM